MFATIPGRRAGAGVTVVGVADTGGVVKQAPAAESQKKQWRRRQHVRAVLRWWQARALADPEWQRGGGDLRCVVLDADDAPAAYALYRMNDLMDHGYEEEKKKKKKKKLKSGTTSKKKKKKKKKKRSGDGGGNEVSE